MSNGPSFYGELPESGTTLTTAEYLKTAESVRVQELVYGTLRLADSPSPMHQSLVFRLARTLDDHARRHRLGTIWVAPLDVILDTARGVILQPDLFFVSNARSHIVTDHVWGAPDLVIEVLSPHPRIGKLDERIRLFARYGVAECWIVHQLLRQIEVLNLRVPGSISRHRFSAHEVLASKIFPFFGTTVASLTGWPAEWPKKDESKG